MYAMSDFPFRHSLELESLKVLRKYVVEKPGQNKKGQKILQLHRYLNTFLQLAAEKKYSKKRCSWKFFRPFLFCDGFSCMNIQRYMLLYKESVPVVKKRTFVFIFKPRWRFEFMMQGLLSSATASMYYFDIQ